MKDAALARPTMAKTNAPTMEKRIAAEEEDD
jgi:hypothetical protein